MASNMKGISSHQRSKVSLKDAVDTIRKVNVDYDFDALKAEREE